MLTIKTVPTTAFMQNTRIIYDSATQSALICDPGTDSLRLGEYLQAHQLSLKAIILTHGHLDHVGGAASLARRFNVPIIGPAVTDEPLIAALQQQAQAFGLPPAEGFSPQWVHDGDNLELLPQVNFSVITTPGHTPGGVSWYVSAAQIVLCGDTLFAGSVGRTDFPGGDFTALEHSIRDKLYALPEETRVLCGHGPDTTIGQERLYNSFVRA